MGGELGSLASHTMSERPVRRASYGPSSPVVGERGARTRDAIIEAALACFEEKGFHATYVDDIAEAVGISRAALYQYFESKEQLFVELVHAGGRDLLRVIRRLGSLGPTAEGFDNLHWWLGEWAWVHDKYRAVFIQWSAVDSPEASMRPLMVQFIESYSGMMSERLAASAGADLGLHPDDLAVALLAILLRVNDYRQRGFTRGLTDDSLLDGLATFVQLTLYPTAPAGALHLGERSVAPLSAPGEVVPLRWSPSTSAAAPRPQPDPERFGSGSPRVLQTVERLLDAGAKVFAARGYHDSSVEDVRVEAGLGRGTFYKYFDDKADLLATLAEDCAVRLDALVERFDAALRDGDGAELRAWLRDFVQFHHRYWSVFRAWTEQDPPQGPIAAFGLAAAESMLATFDRALGRTERDYPFDTRAGSIVLMAMLERVPGYALGTAYEISDDRIVEVLALLIERGLLGSHRPQRRGRAARRR